MDKRDYNMSVAITRNMIDDTVKRLQQAVDDERWGRVRELVSYLAGLRMALFNFGVTYIIH